MGRRSASASARSASRVIASPRPPDRRKKGTRGSPSSSGSRDRRSRLEQLDSGDVGAVTGPVPQLENPGVTTGSGRESRADLSEELGERVAVLDPPARQAAGVQIAAARQGNQLFGERPQLLGF